MPECPQKWFVVVLAILVLCMTVISTPGCVHENYVVENDDGTETRPINWTWTGLIWGVAAMVAGLAFWTASY